MSDVRFGSVDLLESSLCVALKGDQLGGTVIERCAAGEKSGLIRAQFDPGIGAGGRDKTGFAELSISEIADIDRAGFLASCRSDIDVLESLGETAQRDQEEKKRFHTDDCFRKRVLPQYDLIFSLEQSVPFPIRLEFVD